MQNIREFIQQHQSVSPNSDIQARWEERVVGQGLHLRGAAGAAGYAGQFLKGAKPPKVIAFARLAEIHGYQAMANQFWAIAYHLATGKRETVETDGASTPGAAVPPAPALKELFRYRPQLLKVLTRAEAMIRLATRSVCIQRKHDGERLMTKIEAGAVTGGNKKGFRRAVPLNVADALAGLLNAVVDGELVDATYWVFDLLELDGVDLRALPYARRYQLLQDQLAGRVPAAYREAVQLVVSVTGDEEAKRRYVEELEASGAEGFVLKELTASYVSGEDHDSQWKFQFRVTGAFIVGERNGDKSSVEVFVVRADGTRRSMGNVTIKANQPFPSPGTIGEVLYLYAFKSANGKLNQPEFKGTRTDCDAEDCQEGKLKVEAA